MGLFDRFRRAKAPPGVPVAEPRGVVLGEPSQRAVGWAMRAADQLMALHPEGWRHLEVALTEVQGVPRVDRVDVELPEQLLEPAGLFIDPGLRTAWLADHLSRLNRELGLEPSAFSSWNVHLDRASEERATLSTMGKTIALALDALTCAPALLRFLHEHGRAMQGRQDALREAIGAWGGWGGWERESKRIAFEDAQGTRRTLAAEVVGSFAPDEGTWCWAWANSSFDPPLQGASLRVRTEAPPGIPMLTRGGFACDPPFAYTAAMLAGHLLGGLPVYRFEVPRSAVQLFFAVEMPPRDRIA